MNEEIVQAGRDAFSAGRKRNECPYPPASTEAADWTMGWSLQLQHQITTLRHTLRKRSVGPRKEQD